MFWLLDSSDFVQRTHCGEWPSWLIIAVVMSDILIWLAYMTISFLLFIYWKRCKKFAPQRKICACFVAFIFLCGLSHLMDAAMFWWPMYRLTAFVFILTAIASLGTALYLPGVMLFLLTLRTQVEYNELNVILQKELELERTLRGEFDQIITLLEMRLGRIDKEIAKESWLGVQNIQLDELRDTLKTLKEKALELTIRVNSPNGST